jgi:hypothetical protein
MTDDQQTGTLETVAHQLAILLAPLREELSEGQLLDLFADLGYRFPPSVDDQLAATVSGVLDAGTALDAGVSQMIAASKAKDLIALGIAVEQVLQAFQQLIAGLDPLVSAVTAAITGIAGLTPAEVSAFVAELPERLLAYSVVRVLDESVPVLAFVLELFGVIVRSDEQFGSSDPLRPPFTRVTLELERLPQVLSAPNQLLADLYGWGSPTFDGVALFSKLATMFSRLGFPAFYDAAQVPPVLDVVVAEARAVGGALELTPRATVGESLQYQDPDAGITATAKVQLHAADGAKLTLRPGGSMDFAAPGHATTTGELQLSLAYVATSGQEPVLLFGQQGGPRIEATKTSLALGAAFTWDATQGRAVATPVFEARVDGGTFVIVPPSGDGFLGSVLPGDGVSATFDLVAGYGRDGWYFQGSGGLEVVIPVHANLGPVSVKAVTLGIGAQNAELEMTAAVSFGVHLGPIDVEIQQIGVRLDAAFGSATPNLGVFDLSVALKPPSGAGLTIDGGPVSGGGTLTHDPARGRYAGAAILRALDHVLSAFGVLDTKVPSGYSLLVAIQARIPPIPLGLGFNLLGVGGMVGAHRTAALDVIRSGLRDGGLATILYPDDPVSTFDQILTEIDRVLPTAQGRFIVAPTARIGWGTPTLLTADVALVFELPDPIKLALIGVVRCFLPDTDSPLLRLQASFLGTVDFDTLQLAFDASLFDSKLLSFSLDGDMSARMQWGALLPNLLLTVGGFHPAYTPPPMNLPALRRITIDLLGGTNPRLRADVYFARTSNSFQLGAHVELYAAVSKFNIYGFVGFDALVQILPTHFDADVKAMLAVRIGDDPIMSVDVEFALSGPAPWHAKGKAHFDICWFLGFDVHFDKTWGDGATLPAGEIDVLPLLAAALGDAHNWNAPLPGNTHALVTLRQHDDGFVDPAGTLTVSQKLVPLDLDIQRFSALVPRDATRFSIDRVTTQDPHTQVITQLDIAPVAEEFAPAQFLEMSDADKLARPSFEQFHSGVVIASSDRLVADDVFTVTVEYEQIIVDRAQPSRGAGRLKLDAAALDSLAQAGAIGRSPLARNSRFAPRSPTVAVAPETYTVVSSVDLAPAVPGAALTYSEAVEHLARLASDDFHIVATSELSA